MKLVVDASALFDYLLRPDEIPLISTTLRSPRTELHVPELTDIEIASALRNALFAGSLPESRLDQALADYFDLPLTRHRHRLLIERVLQLGRNFSPYDATYIALAERLDANLLTADAALARAVRRHLHLGVLP